MCEERDTTFGCHWENIERLKGKENLALYRESKKNRQHNDQKKKDKRSNNDLQNTTQKTNDRETRTKKRTTIQSYGNKLCYQIL
jgi:hypothetical protein